MDHFARIGVGRQAQRARVIWKDGRLYVATADGTRVYAAPDEPTPTGRQSGYTAAGVEWTKSSCSCGYPRALKAPMRQLVRAVEKRLAAGELQMVEATVDA